MTPWELAGTNRRDVMRCTQGSARWNFTGTTTSSGCLSAESQVTRWRENARSFGDGAERKCRIGVDLVARGRVRGRSRIKEASRRRATERGDAGGRPA